MSFFFHIFGALAQFERSLIQERGTGRTLRQRVGGGRRGGASPSDRCRETRRSDRGAGDSGATKAAVCRTFGIKRSTLLGTPGHGSDGLPHCTVQEVGVARRQQLTPKSRSLELFDPPSVINVNWCVTTRFQIPTSRRSGAVVAITTASVML